MAAAENRSGILHYAEKWSRLVNSKPLQASTAERQFDFSVEPAYAEFRLAESLP
jgi:hypothetical protein